MSDEKVYEVETTIGSISEFPGEYGPSFLVRVDFAIRKGFGNDILGCDVKIPFDENATYAQLKDQAIIAARDLVSSIREI